MMIRNTSLLLLLTAAASSAFVVGPASSLSTRFGVMVASRNAPVLFSQEEGTPADDGAAADAPEQTEAAAASEEPSAADEVLEVPEDPAMTTLKEEIANAESDLKGKKSTLDRIEEDVEKYTKGGYARRVAQVEDMKRIRMSMQSSNKETAVAAVVQNFLPVLDELKTLKEEYGEDEFGSKYAGLTGAMLGGLKELGVEEFTVSEGEAVNPQRVSVVEQEFNQDVEKGSIIRPVSMGMELAGNVMRLAQVVASLGSESAGSDEDADIDAVDAVDATEEEPSGEDQE